MRHAEVSPQSADFANMEEGWRIRRTIMNDARERLELLNHSIDSLADMSARDVLLASNIPLPLSRHPPERTDELVPTVTLLAEVLCISHATCHCIVPISGTRS